MNDLREISKRFENKLKKIKVVLFDVDGILTDGRLFWAGEKVGWSRFFHASDGYGMKLLQRSGFKVGIITGGNSESVFRRFRDDLKLDYIFTNDENKMKAWKKICDEGYLEPELCFMGDEYFDLPLLKRAGFSATASHSSMEIKKAVDYVAQRPAGNACAREVMDIICYAHGIDATT